MKNKDKRNNKVCSGISWKAILFILIAFIDTIAVKAQCSVDISIVTPQQLTCIASSVILMGHSSTPGVDFQWIGGPADADYVVSTAGVYTLVVTESSNGCTATATVAVLANTTAPGVSLQSMVNTCQGKTDGALVLSATGTGLTFTWNNGTTTENQSGLAAGSYTVTVTAANGCTATTSATILGLNGPIVNVGKDDTINPGQSAQLSVSGGVSYLWSPATGLNSTTISNPLADPLITTNYTVTAIGLNGCSTTAVETVTILCPGCVWPGDADENGIANNYDMLALGLGYGNVGAARTTPTINWIGQAAANWTQTLPGLGVNDKFADCNGDGIIDFHDTTAIVQNYGLTHNLRMRQPDYINGLPDLKFNIPVDTTFSGTMLAVPISLGSSTNKVNDIYGIAFGITYDPTIVDTSKISLSLNGSWLGSNGSNLIYITKNFGLNGQLEVGITRTDHQDISGSGTVATLNIGMKDDIGMRTSGRIFKTLMLSAVQVKAINSNDSAISFNAVADSVVVEQGGTAGINGLSSTSNVKIYPNPASGSFSVELNSLAVQKIQLMNVLGEIVWQQTNNMLDKITVDTQNLAAGTYYLAILTSQERVVKRLDIIK